MQRRPVEFEDWPAALAAGYGPYRAVVTAHIDGDTCWCLLDVGWNHYTFSRIRLLGCDTPETNRAGTRAAGLAAKAFVIARMPLGAKVLLFDPQPDPDNFGRYLARIRLVDGTDLTELLISSGHATPF